MVIDILVSQTFARLAGVRALLDLLDEALPRSEWYETEALRKMAQQQHWPVEDFMVEEQVLNEKFRFWLPRFTAYSTINLLHTVLETQLAECALVVHSDHKVPFAPSDIRGRGIERAALYISRAGVFDVKRDEVWPTICDVSDLRHLIVHSAGSPKENDEHRKLADRLTKKYPGRLEFPTSFGTWYNEVWVSIPLCREWIAMIETFFDRVFDGLGRRHRNPDRSDANSA